MAWPLTPFFRWAAKACWRHVYLRGHLSFLGATRHDGPLGPKRRRWLVPHFFHFDGHRPYVDGPEGPILGRATRLAGGHFPSHGDGPWDIGDGWEGKGCLPHLLFPSFFLRRPRLDHDILRECWVVWRRLRPSTANISINPVVQAARPGFPRLRAPMLIWLNSDPLLGEVADFLDLDPRILVGQSMVASPFIFLCVCMWYWYGAWVGDSLHRIPPPFL